jgi:hypothetical protein
VPDPTWTAVVGSLQQAGLINYRRGAIKVLDRLGLEAAACECYRMVRDGYERSLVRAVALMQGTIRQKAGYDAAVV